MTTHCPKCGWKLASTPDGWYCPNPNCLQGPVPSEESAAASSGGADATYTCPCGFGCDSAKEIDAHAEKCATLSAQGDAAPANTIRAIQAINAARSARWMAGSPGWTTLEIAGELAGEVGELANICKKLRRSEMGVPGNKVSDEELLEQARGEIADVFIVLMLTASKLGIDLEDAVRDTFNRKSEQMGFPERVAGPAPAQPRCTAHWDGPNSARCRFDLGHYGRHGFDHTEVRRA